jgi:predicted permease
MDSEPPSTRDPAEKYSHLVSVSPEYFDNFGIRALLGRTFSARDDGRAPKIAILNQTAAHFFFGDANPIGKKIKFAKRLGEPVFEVAAVVNDAKHASLREEPQRFTYVPIPQAFDRINRLTFAVRTSGGDPLALAAPVRREIQGAGSTLLITNVSTLEEQMERTLLRERLVSALSVAFGALALALTCIGLYGILAYAVARRTNEIGIRLALGATRSGTVWMILREALALAAAGCLLGTPAVLLLGRASQSLLYGVAAFDPWAVAAAAAGLLVFAAAAGFAPARRASRLEPLAALRCD